MIITRGGVVVHFNVSQLAREPSGSTRQYPVDECVPIPDGEIQMAGTVQLVKTDKTIWVTAQLSTAVESACGRCLEPYVQPVAVTIDEEALPILDPTSGVRALDDREAAERIVIDEDNVLDLTEAARQYVALGLPMQPLCRIDCAGLCDACGVDRNDEPCDCAAATRASIWAPLLEIAPSIQTIDRSKNS